MYTREHRAEKHSPDGTSEITSYRESINLWQCLLILALLTTGVYLTTATRTHQTNTPTYGTSNQ